jgi:hypothetical protein
MVASEGDLLAGAQGVWRGRPRNGLEPPPLCKQRPIFESLGSRGGSLRGFALPQRRGGEPRDRRSKVEEVVSPVEQVFRGLIGPAIEAPSDLDDGLAGVVEVAVGAIEGTLGVREGLLGALQRLQEGSQLLETLLGVDAAVHNVELWASRLQRPEPALQRAQGGVAMDRRP